MFYRIARRRPRPRLARAVRADGSVASPGLSARGISRTSPSMPFTYMSETDRVLVFADLLFDPLAPQTRERHRALVRLEDINPTQRPRAASRRCRLPPREGHPVRLRRRARAIATRQGARGRAPYEHPAPRCTRASSLRYPLSPAQGGVLVGHGYTHQSDGGSNPYNRVTGDDVEFYRVTESPDGEVRTTARCRATQSLEWSERRIVAANRRVRGRGSPGARDLRVPPLHRLRARLPRPPRRASPARWERVALLLRRAHRQAGATRPRSSASSSRTWCVTSTGPRCCPENLGSITPSRGTLTSRVGPTTSSAPPRQPRRARRLRGLLLPPVPRPPSTSSTTIEGIRSPRLHLRRPVLALRRRAGAGSSGSDSSGGRPSGTSRNATPPFFSSSATRSASPVSSKDASDDR